ncbi:suppressor of fused domain protein [Micromonospora sp. DT53]|uniref:suppressor of fused domain protein n=1 Tax=Micromonospora sp. DT53 TaxID=3393444 RepID=UPI003CF62989
MVSAGPVGCAREPVAVGVHVYVVAPTEERPYRTLITSGMSELPMTVPEGHGISPYAELMLCLPADWPLTRRTGLDDDPAGWPLRVLKHPTVAERGFSRATGRALRARSGSYGRRPRTRAGQGP